MAAPRVVHLNCATMCPVGAALLGQPGGLRRGRLVSHCLLVETPRDGLVLVDTGFGTRDVAGQTAIHGAFGALVAPRLAAEETALHQLRARGYAADDVRHVVVTHLDLDHAGGLPDFPRARVHLHRRELEAALAPTRRERPRYLAAHWAHGPRWEAYAEEGDAWRGLPAVTRLRGLEADVALVPLHGHTRGHAAVVVRDGDRWLVHAGDAYYHRAALEGRREPPGLALFARLTAVDEGGRRASLAALGELARRHADVRIFSSHDPAELDEPAG